MTTSSLVPGEKTAVKYSSCWYWADTSLFCPSAKDTCTSTWGGRAVRGRAGGTPQEKGWPSWASASANTALHWHLPVTRDSTSTPLAPINHLFTQSHRWKVSVLLGENKHLRQNCVRKNTRVSTPSHGKRIRAKDFHSPCTHSCAKLALQGTQVPVVQAHC